MDDFYRQFRKPLDPRMQTWPKGWMLPGIRAFNVLNEAEIFSPEDLQEKTFRDLVRVRGCGLQTAMELAEMCKEHGTPLEFGYTDLKPLAHPFKNRKQLDAAIAVCRTNG